MIFSSLGIFAQSSKISGTVSDKNGVPLPGVTIVIKGTTKGTVTDVNGKFSIPAAKGVVLQISFVGMQTKEITVADNSNLSVVLIEDVIGIGEVIAIGYGSKKKESLTSAISNIQSDEILTTTHSSLAQALEGKVSGLQIRQNTGEPGSFDTRINVRGFGTPLYVIDGVPREGNSGFQRINPEDIESISVLKDAAAAIYGLRAANGVIIVTTKKGKKGKIKFNYNGVFGVQSPTDVPKMATAYQYVQMVNRARIFSGLGPTYTDEEVENYKNGALGYEGTNWYDETFKDQAYQQQHNFSATGGNESVTFFTSLGYVEDNGLLKSNDLGYKKYTFRTNLTAQLTKNLKADIQIAGRYDKKESPGESFFMIFKATRTGDPTTKPFANNNPDYPSLLMPSNQNPIAMSERDISGFNENVNKNFQSTIVLTYNVPFVEGLILTGRYSYDSNNSMVKSLGKSYKLYDYDAETEKYTGYTQHSPTRISNNWSDYNLLNYQTQISYNKSFNNVHNVSATVVYEQQRTFERWAWLKREYDFFTNDQIDQGSLNNQQTSGNERQTGSRSIIGRLNYDYKGKYLIEYAFRYDGSYRYHPDYRWGFFPVLTAGWRVSEENFFKDAVPVISNLKLRGSWGIVGEDAGAPFQYVEGFGTSGGGGYEFEDGVYQTGASAPSIVNPALTWFESQITDIGFDLGMWNNAFSLEFDVYQRYREGLLAKRNISLPNTFGGELPEENLNSDRVRGFDVAAGYRNNVGDFHYEIRGNFNYARTNLEYVERGPFTSSWDYWKNGRENRFNDIVWGYVLEGQFQNEDDVLFAPIQSGNGNLKELPGDFKYKDMNGDGLVNGNDMVPRFYNGTPKQYYGLTLAAQWKGFDITALFQGSGKYTVRFKEVYAQMFAFRGNTPAYFYDSWTQNEDGSWNPGEWPANRYNTDVGAMYAESEVWRKDASYFRLKTVDLGYTFRNQTWMKTIGIDNMRVYANGHNLITWTDDFVKPFDPEKIEGSYSAGLTYPLTRSFNMGVN
ncbi:MAG: TonB-dependent receptor, partial [Prolixibacteraceae bacterium]|nr:TonB-dependent receptor [Prolixibacteraceae bacterium]